MVGLVWVGGCVRPEAGPAADYVAPVSVLQHKAYAEARTGRFASLVDFEKAPGSGRPGYTQVGLFKVLPAAGSELKYVVNITRTGTGAMQATLPPGSVLELDLPAVHDFSRYSLLLMAVYSRAVRDDLKITLISDKAPWEALPVLLEKGWNSVLVDLGRLADVADFVSRRVRKIRLRFAAAAKPVTINLDDVLVIDNRRHITPLPPGMALWQAGLDYVLTVPWRAKPLRMCQGDDGLWRLGPDQALIELARGGSLRPAGGEGSEDLSAFGARRVGRAAVVEANAVRVRLVNTWYFPARAGEWASMAIRQVRWEYTFYGDGREVTDVVVNNAGGAEFSAVRITAPAAAAWSGGRVARRLELKEVGGSVGRWSYLIAAAGPGKKRYESDYLKPGRLDVRIGSQEACDGDVEADGFDESQGCYHVRAEAGRCRFRISPGPGGLVDPVIRVGGPWPSAVTVGSEGLALRSLGRLPDGSVVFVLPGEVDAPRWVEITGRGPPRGEQRRQGAK